MMAATIIQSSRIARRFLFASPLAFGCQVVELLAFLPVLEQGVDGFCHHPNEIQDKPAKQHDANGIECVLSKHHISAFLVSQLIARARHFRFEFSPETINHSKDFTFSEN
jgi:hypothetical protein